MPGRFLFSRALKLFYIYKTDLYGTRKVRLYCLKPGLCIRMAAVIFSFSETMMDLVIRFTYLFSMLFTVLKNNTHRFLCQAIKLLSVFIAWYKFCLWYADPYKRLPRKKTCAPFFFTSFKQTFKIPALQTDPPAAISFKNFRYSQPSICSSWIFNTRVSSGCCESSKVTIRFSPGMIPFRG